MACSWVSVAAARGEVLELARMAAERSRSIEKGGDVLVEALLLEDAGGVAGEAGAEEVGLGGEAAGALDEVGEGLVGADGVDAGADELAFEADVLGLLVLGDVDVGLGEDGDDVAGLQGEILGGVVAFDEAAEIEGDERAFEGVGIEPLDDGVRPVDLGGGDLDLDALALGGEVAIAGGLLLLGEGGAARAVAGGGQHVAGGAVAVLILAVAVLLLGAFGELGVEGGVVAGVAGVGAVVPVPVVVVVVGAVGVLPVVAVGVVVAGVLVVVGLTVIGAAIGGAIAVDGVAVGVGVVAVVGLVVVVAGVPGKRLEERGGDAEAVAFAPVVVGEQGGAVGDDLAEAHALVPGEAAGIGEIAADGDGLLVAVEDGVEVEDVAVAEDGVAAGLVEGDRSWPDGGGAPRCARWRCGVSEAVGGRPPASSRRLPTVVPGLISKMAGWRTLPAMATWGPTTGMKMTSSGSRRTSLDLSPRTARS